MTRRQQLLDFAILGLLHDAPMHGYELRKHLNLTMGVFRALSYGTLYPALRGLVAGGSITESTDAGAVTAASRRPRIVYELTDSTNSLNKPIRPSMKTSYSNCGWHSSAALTPRCGYGFWRGAGPALNNVWPT